VSIRQRRCHALSPQRFEPGSNVGPRVQPVPRAHEPVTLLQGKVDSSLGEQILQRHKVKLIEVAPWPRAVIDLYEDGPIPGASGVGEFLRLARHVRRAKRVHDPRTPIHKCSEYVKDKRAHGHRASLSSSLAGLGFPPSSRATGEGQ
jgi:hypothetical protein